MVSMWVVPLLEVAFEMLQTNENSHDSLSCKILAKSVIIGAGDSSAKVSLGEAMVWLLVLTRIETSCTVPILLTTPIDHAIGSPE